MTLEWDHVAIQRLAAERGTPFYLYDLDVMRARISDVRAALRALDPPLSLFFAAKANPNLEVLRRLAPVVDGLDVASTGEVELALRAGISAEKLQLAGPGKTQVTLEHAIDAGVGRISIESERELEVVASIAKAKARRVEIVLRLNPEQRTHAFAVPMTGVPSPFGIDVEDLDSALACLSRHLDSPLVFGGIHVHGGGQCSSAEGFAAHARGALALARRLERDHQLPCPTVNFGGGLGVVPGRPVPLERLARALASACTELASRTRPTQPRLELGRYIAALAGIYVARVISTKRSRGRSFVVLDGGMNHLFAATGLLAPRAPRSSIANLSLGEDRPKTRVTIVGPLCTPLDTLGVDVELPTPEVGDLIGVLDSGAYGYTLSPLLFLGHDTPLELIRDGGSIIEARGRKRALDLI